MSVWFVCFILYGGEFVHWNICTGKGIVCGGCCKVMCESERCKSVCVLSRKGVLVCLVMWWGIYRDL